MPKAELHLHLDGSLRVDTALDLARTRDIDAPRDWSGMSAALIAPMPCASQAELLRAFDLPIALMQDAEALERITAELVETKAADGVRYVEIRWGPLLHVTGGLSLADGIGAVCAGARDAAFRTGTVVRLICTALRSHDPAANLDLARVAVQFRDQGLTGWDLAGPEEAYPDPLLHAATPTRPPATAASGSRSTPANGAVPARSDGRWPSNRNGSPTGPGAIDDPDLCAELIVRGVTLDLCPTSNWQAGIVPSIAAHPLARLHRPGVPVTLNTDDTTVSDITLSEEYLRAVETDRADPARAVGAGPSRARRGVRGRVGPRTAARGLRRVGCRRSPSSHGGRRLSGLSRRESSRIAASAAASAAIAVGASSGGSASTSARVVTPVSMNTQRAPTARAAAEVRGDAVADHDRLGRLATDGMRRGLQQVRGGLADRDRHDPGRGLERR